MKTLMAFLILGLAQTAFADAGSLENCAYEKSKELIQTVQSTVGIRSASQLNAMSRLLSMFCTDKSLSEKDATDALNKGFKRATAEMVPSPTLNQLGRPWQETAIANLTSELQGHFKDSTVTIVDSSGLTTTVDHEKKIVGGTIQLTNGFSCQVSSEIDDTTNSLQGCNIQQFACRNGSNVTFATIKHDCD